MGKWNQSIYRSIKNWNWSSSRSSLLRFHRDFWWGCYCKSPLAIYLVSAKFLFLFFFLFTLQFRAPRLQFLHEFSSSSLSLYSSLVLFWALFFTWNSLLHLGFLLHIWLLSLLGLSFFFLFKIGTQFFMDLSSSLRLYTLDPYKSFLWQNFLWQIFFS